MPDSQGRSEAIASIRYNEKTMVLTLRMQSGRKGQGAVLKYGGVPADIVEALRSARSQGDFFNHHIRNVYDYLG